MGVGYIEILRKKDYIEATKKNGLIISDKCQNCGEWNDNIYHLTENNRYNFIQQRESAYYDGYIRANKLCKDCYNKFAKEDKSQQYMLKECIDI